MELFRADYPINSHSKQITLLSDFYNVEWFWSAIANSVSSSSTNYACYRYDPSRNSCTSDKSAHRLPNKVVQILCSDCDS